MPKDFSPLPWKYSTLTLTCHICHTSMGQVGLNTDKYPANATQEMLGFIDNRCTPCESTNGTFKDLQTQAIQVLGLTPASAETFVANNRTKTAFNSALSNALKSNVTIKPI